MVIFHSSKLFKLAEAVRPCVVVMCFRWRNVAESFCTLDRGSSKWQFPCVLRLMAIRTRLKNAVAIRPTFFKCNYMWPLAHASNGDWSYCSGDSVHILFYWLQMGIRLHVSSGAIRFRRTNMLFAFPLWKVWVDSRMFPEATTPTSPQPPQILQNSSVSSRSFRCSRRSIICLPG